MEKPLAATADDAQRMMLASARHAVVLAVGHVERFNPAFLAVRHQVQQPCAIEAARTGGFTFRSTDVGVVLDLMIHDLDLVLSLVPSPVVRIDAVGLPVVTEHEDVAQARIEFADGCVASLKASRTSPQAQRQMTVYEREQHVFVDFNERSVQVMLRSNPLREGSFRLADCPPAQIAALKGHVFDQLLPVSTLEVAEANPLRDELVDFVNSVRGRHRPRVSAEDAYRSRPVGRADLPADPTQLAPVRRRSHPAQTTGSLNRRRANRPVRRAFHPYFPAARQSGRNRLFDTADPLPPWRSCSFMMRNTRVSCPHSRWRERAGRGGLWMAAAKLHGLPEDAHPSPWVYPRLPPRRGHDNSPALQCWDPRHRQDPRVPRGTAETVDPQPSSVPPGRR